jgi:hypothetical protein
LEPEVSRIHQCLQKLLGLHRQLMDTVRLEKEALVAADLKGIQETTLAKEAILQAVRHAESERLAAAAALAMAWKKPLRELTLPAIVIAIQGRDGRSAELLRSTHNALRILIERIVEMNAENRVLVESSLGHVEKMKKNVLGEAVPAADVYTSQGQRTAGSAAAAPRLISREA